MTSGLWVIDTNGDWQTRDKRSAEGLECEASIRSWVTESDEGGNESERKAPSIAYGETEDENTFEMIPQAP